MIEIVLHGGYQRCATTFLQEKVFFQLKEYECLSKPHDFYFNKNSKNIFLENKQTNTGQNYELMQLQNEVFPRKYSFQNNLPFNLDYRMKKYKNCLVKAIKKSDKKKFILSDETIFDRINYFGDTNLLVLAEIINSIKNEMDLKIKVILTIRNQIDLMSSIYSFDHYRQKKNFKSLDNFLEKFTSPDNYEYGEIFNFYDQYKKLRFFFSEEILILPLEQLEKTPQVYFNRIKNFLNTEFKISENKSVKKLSTITKKGRSFALRENKFQRTFEFFSKIHSFLNLFDFYKKFYQDSKQLKRFKNSLREKMKFTKTGEIEIDYFKQKKVKSFYSESNKAISKESGIDLGSLGYF